MTPRDAALLPRLLLSLDTLENPGEIGQTILQIRRILASSHKKLSEAWIEAPLDDARHPPLDDDVWLVDARHDVSVKLRSLGMFLKCVEHPDPRIQHAIESVRLALIDGTVASGAELRLVLCCLADILHRPAFAATPDMLARMRTITDPEQTYTMDDLNTVMGAIRENMGFRNGRGQ